MTTANDPRAKKGLALGIGLALVLAAALGVGIYRAARPQPAPQPQAYDEIGQVFYTAGDGREYQVLVAWPNNRCEPAPDIYQCGRENETSRWPSRLYVNHKATGEDAWTDFSPLVDKAEIEVIQSDDALDPLTATQPEHTDYSPDAALVSYLDFTGRSRDPQVVWTLTMKNGDVIRVRQNLHITPIYTLEYHYTDYPMDTLAELQALLDRLETETDRIDEVKIYLPPVTYTGQLELKGRSYEFHGCTDGTGRTVFAGNIQVTTEKAYWLNYFYDMDFVGRSDQVGLSAGGKTWAIDCTFTGYKTGVLAYGEAWVNLTGCTFTGNTVGFHFNSTGQSASDDSFHDNTFTGNGTGVLLENVPTDMTIYFDGSVFSGNGTDLDNRCDHPVDLSKATMEG